jgi:hypothetical protein
MDNVSKTIMAFYLINAGICINTIFDGENKGTRGTTSNLVVRTGQSVPFPERPEIPTQYAILPIKDDLENFRMPGAPATKIPLANSYVSPFTKQAERAVVSYHRSSANPGYSNFARRQDKRENPRQRIERRKLA